MALEFVLLPETTGWRVMLLAIRRSMARFHNSISIPALRRDGWLLSRGQSIRKLEARLRELEAQETRLREVEARSREMEIRLRELEAQDARSRELEARLRELEQLVQLRERVIIEREQTIAKREQTVRELEGKLEGMKEFSQFNPGKDHVVSRLRDELAKRRRKKYNASNASPSVATRARAQITKTDEELSALLARWKEVVATGRFIEAGSQRFLDPYIVHKNLAGAPAYILISTLEGRVWYDKFDVTEAPYLQMLGMIHPGDVILDCGSNQGINSLTYSSIVGEAGHVHAFDPFPINCAIAKFNVKINDRKNITIYQRAVSNREEVLTISVDRQDILQRQEAGDTITATAVTIDSFALKPNFIKIDVEGAEINVLEGATATLNFEPFIYLELHPAQIALFGRRVDEIFNFIDLQRYSCLINYHGYPMLVEYSKQFELENSCQMFFLPKSSPPVTRFF
jgi:FkbM family methyltransferase